jgi:hypothetical protein
MSIMGINPRTGMPLSKGDVIYRGEQIGAVGGDPSGSIEKNHLHFEIRKTPFRADFFPCQSYPDGGTMILSRYADPTEFIMLNRPDMVTFERSYGGDGDDWGYSVQQSSDGGYIIAGITDSFSAGNHDVYLIKTDAGGHMTWQKTFGGVSTDSGFSMQQTTDEGYIIAGYTKSYGAGGNDVYLIKTDVNGNLTWEKTFGGAGNDLGYSVEQTADGGYIITGLTGSLGAGGNDVYLIKTDAGGNLTWEKTFGGASGDLGYQVQQTTDSGYIISGRTDSFGSGGSDVYLIKTDAGGNLTWEKTFGGSSDDTGYSVQQTTDGGYIISGRTDLYGTGHCEVFLIKTDADGNMIWENTFAIAYYEKGISVQQTEDGGFVIAGQTDLTPSIYPDLYIIKTDADGNLMWEKTYDGFGPGDQEYERGYSVQQTADNGYIIAGYTSSVNYGDVYLIKTDTNGNVQ